MLPARLDWLLLVSWPVVVASKLVVETVTALLELEATLTVVETGPEFEFAELDGDLKEHPCVESSGHLLH